MRKDAKNNPGQINRNSNHNLKFYSLSERNNSRTNPKNKGFTLIELIIVVITVGILAALGLTQYNLVIERSRTTEAKMRIGVMRNTAYEYYLENGSLTGISDAYLGVDFTCTPTNFFRYRHSLGGSSNVSFYASRCTSGGKTPNTPREYYFYMRYDATTGQSDWHCQYDDDGSSCFGLPP